MPTRRDFSALQRAENSSMSLGARGAHDGWIFQCSSASRKFLNQSARHQRLAAAEFQCSSASRKFLNRARSTLAEGGTKISVLFSEPKIPQCVSIVPHRRRVVKFQCSSASRKFLNLLLAANVRATSGDFSALQRAENSSMLVAQLTVVTIGISVLFSEPKIPQCGKTSTREYVVVDYFSALQRAENSSMISYGGGVQSTAHFSALQRAENSSMPDARTPTTQP